MRRAIVDLDPDAEGRGHRTRARSDRGAIAALVLACGVFALAVWVARPAAAPATAEQVRSDANVSSAAVPRGAILHPLALPPDAKSVDLGILPDRLANEAAPYQWRRVITVRGTPGVASVEGPAVISWSERGILYWLSSPTRSTDELIKIADDMR